MYGFRRTQQHGPIVTPSPAIIFNKLKAIFAASRFGMISRLASLSSESQEILQAQALGNGCITVHFTFNFQCRGHLLQQLARMPHLACGFIVKTAKA